MQAEISLISSDSLHSINPCISVVICTHNRADYLYKSIKSLEEQTLSQAEFEIIIVDNFSTDNTCNLINNDFAYLTNLRYVYEPILGLSQARNTGWKTSKGEYVAYLDDDAIADPNWLAKILETFHSLVPRPGILCGKVEPIWESTKPEWLPEHLCYLLSILNWSEEPFVLKGKHFCGANMAFPKSILEASGGFNLRLGRKGEKLISGEESLLRQAVERLNYVTYYHPEVEVKHHVPAYRLTKDWLFQRSYWQGISDIYLEVYLECPPILRRMRLITGGIKHLLKSLFWLMCFLPFFQSETKSLELKCNFYRKLGYLIGSLIA